MNQSPTIEMLAKALAEAQGELKPVAMNSVNPFLKNKYADLGAVIDAVRPVLAKHGLAVAQFPFNDPGGIGIETILMHTSGQWLSERVSLPLSDEKGKSAAQVAGSIVTYLRRYALSAVLGVYADEDADGSDPHSASSQTTVKKETAKKPTEQTAVPWYETALAAVKEKSAIYEKPLGETAHGGAFIKKILEAHVGDGRWYSTKADYIEAVKRYTGFATPEEISWRDAEVLIRIATNQRVVAGKPLATIVYQGILTDTEWAAICEASKITGSSLIEQAERDDLILWLKSAELMGEPKDIQSLADNLVKIVKAYNG